MMLPISMHRDCSSVVPGAQWLTNADYHAGPALSSSLLAKVATSCLADALLARDQSGVPSGAMMLGSAIHARVLGTDEVVVVDERAYKSTSRRSDKRDADVAALLSDGADIALHPDDVATVDAVEAAIQAHPEAARLLAECDLREVSLFSRDAETGLLLRVRPDAVGSALVDLKTTGSDIDPDSWGRTIWQRGSHVAAALYRDVVTEIAAMHRDGVTEIADPGPMHHIVASTAAPHHVRVYVIGEDTERAGRAAYRQALDTYAAWLKEAREHGQAWAGPSREVEIIDAPAWALRRAG